MKEFKLLAFRDLLILKNRLKEILKNPVRLILYCLFLGWLFRSVWMGSSSSGSTLNEAGVPEDLINEKAYLALSTISGILLLLIFLVSVYTATLRKSTFFRNADVQFIFPSPLRSNWLLLYHVYRGLFPSIVFSLFSYAYLVLVIQPDFWMQSNSSMFLALGTFTLFNFLISPMNFLVFVLLTGKGNMQFKTWIIRGIVLLIPLLLIVPGWGADSLKSFALSVFVDGWFSFLPIVGWTHTLLLSAFPGVSTPLWPLLALLITFLALPWLIFFLVGDYYEDVLQATEQRSKREAMAQGTELGDELEFSWGMNLKSRKGLRDFGSGAKAFFWKAWLMNRRQNLHPVFGFSALLFLLIGTALSLWLGLDDPDPGATEVIFYMGGTFMLLINFIAGIGRVRIGDLNRPMFLLIPAGTLARFYYVTLLDQLQMLAATAFLLIPLLFIEIKLWSPTVLFLLCGAGMYYIGFMLNLLLRLVVRFKWDRLLLRPFTYILLLPSLVLPAVALSWAGYGWLGHPAAALGGVLLVLLLWLLLLWTLIAEEIDRLEIN
jgi:hypothetical protein